MKNLRELGLWQVAAIYLGGAWAVLQAIDLFIDRLAFPTWLFPAALALLGIGFPIVFATAVLQQHTQLTQRLAAAWPKPARRLLTWRNALMGGVIAFAALGATSVADRAFNALSGGSETWARTEGMAALERAVDDGSWESAWPLVQRIESVIASDSAFTAARNVAATRVSFKTQPAGAKVYRRFYDAPDSLWEYIGQTPLADLWFPNGISQVRIDLPGYRTVLRAGAAMGPPFIRTIDQLDVLLDEEQAIPPEMVRIPGGTLSIQNPPLDAIPGIELSDYLMDRHEVTNRDYKRFVESGGYQKREYWKHDFARDGKVVAWDAAMRELVDRTGRPGPATWEASDYPEGDDELPVAGVSWYEATAYAEFAGKSLPTVYHWSRAASTPISAFIVPRSNFSGKGPRAVTASHAMSFYGTYDQAGNVREWCLNESEHGRYIMGGGWNDPAYHFNDAYAQPPWDRSVTNGIRLVRYLDAKNVEAAARPIDLPRRDFRTERPVSAEVFQVFRRQFDYDRMSLNERIESIDSSHADWIKQRVSYDASYNGPRMLLDLYIPKRFAGARAVVIYYPPGNALQLPSSKNVQTPFDFIVKSGRVVAFPIYRGTFERGAGDLKSDYPDTSVKWRDYVILWGKDYRRTIDYLESRSDLDASRIAFYGLSWGGAMGAIIAAIEPRTKAVVLNVGGLNFERTLPEVDQINYAPHVTQPTLMLNGRYDHFFPVETSQLPLFEKLGTATQQKRHVISETGHNVPRPELIRETLAWLDRYLGASK